MADERDRQKNREDEYGKGGKGRKDEVGRSGIYPASAPDAPADAEVRTAGNLVHHTPRKSKTDEHLPKNDQSSGSE